MKISNFLIGFMLLLASGWVLADDLSDIEQLADAGLPQLALQRLNQDHAQPQTGVDNHVAWQRLQWQLLTQIGTPDDILTQAAVLPKDSPADVQHTVALLAAQAAIGKGDGVTARVYLQRLLWQLPVDKTEYPKLRAMVVQSHLLPQADAEAASLMLRYQQDFGQDNALLQIYALALLQAGRGADTHWIRSQLADNDPLAVLIDATSGQWSDSDIKQHLQAMLNSPLSGPVLVQMQKIAAPMNADELQLQINERLLDLVTPPVDLNAALVWKAYRSLTQSFGNVRLLLFGSDTGWADLARQSLSTDPLMARAIWAYLAREGKDPGLRSDAQQQLLAQLLAQHLDRAALRLFESAWPDLASPDFNPTVRYQLGLLALDAGKYPQSASLWQGLTVLPAGVDPTGWQVQRAQLFARTGSWQIAADAVSAWLDRPGNMDSAAAWPMLILTEQLSRQAAMTKQAQTLLVRMQANAEPLQRRVILYRLGQLAAAQQDDLQAAQLFIQAATETPLADAFVWQARLAAAASLDRAGLAEDAKLQYQLVATQSTDADQQAMANYALGMR